VVLERKQVFKRYIDEINHMHVRLEEVSGHSSN